MATFYVSNFGCRATQADGAAIESQLRERGLHPADEPATAGLVVLNTCTVTAAADQDARAAIRRIHRKNPEARIVVTGCYAQRAPEEIAALPGVSCVVGNSHKHKLAEIAFREPWLLGNDSPANPRANGFVPLTQLISEAPNPAGRGGGSPTFVSDVFAHTELQAAPVFDFVNTDLANADAANQRTRPNLKVQDGCDNRCSFCVIPSVRGPSRSLKMETVIAEVNNLVQAGYREVVISGINLGRWGRDFVVSSQLSALSQKRPATGGQRQIFENLVRAILRETELQKLRISSVEPMDWSDELIELMAASARIAKHAHLPLQSGSDAVLRRMHRKYRPWHYREKVEKIREAMPDAAIGADVMVGFPGETEAEFEETRGMVEELPFTYLHVFTYSARPGTAAAAMSRQVPVHAARERNRILRELVAKKKLAFMNRFVGQRVQTITLSTAGVGADGEYTHALTDNYLPMRVRGKHARNRWIEAKVEEVWNGELLGIAS